MAIQKKTVALAGSLRTRRSRTPQASTTDSTAAGVTIAASAANENSGGAPPAATGRIISMGWLLIGK